MQKLNSHDFQAMLNATPNIPGNEAIRAHLKALIQASQVDEVQFWYPVVTNAIAVGATVDLNFKVDGSGDFWCDEIALFASLGGAAQTFSSIVIPDVDIVISDQSSNRKWMTDATPLSQIASNAAVQRKLDRPHLITANGGVDLTVTSNETVSTPTLRIVFCGRRLYPMGAQSA